MSKDYLTRSEMVERFGLPMSVIIRMSVQGLLPLPYEAEPFVMGWRKRDLANWQRWRSARDTCKDLGLDPDEMVGADFVKFQVRFVDNPDPVDERVWLAG